MQTEKNQTIDDDDPALLLNLGTHTTLPLPSNLPHHESSCPSSQLANRYYNAAMLQYFAFHFELSAYLFEKCLQHAPWCIMCHWGVAACHGPNYNFMGENYVGFMRGFEKEEEEEEGCDVNDDESLLLGFDGGIENEPQHRFPRRNVAVWHCKMALLKAEILQSIVTNNGAKDEEEARQKLLEKVNLQSHPPPRDAFLPTQFEISVIKATCHRCAIPIYPSQDDMPSPKDEFQTISTVYTTAIGSLYHSNQPPSTLLSLLYADALMTPHAWKLFHYPTGKPTIDVDTTLIHSVLTNALSLNPTHAGLIHLYIHYSEMSIHPDQALSYCLSLRSNHPDAGHLLHMPTHIDILLGNYEECTHFNTLAIDADLRTLKQAPEQSCMGTFYLSYIAHDYHMLVYGAMMGGYYQKAISAATDLCSLVNEESIVQTKGVEAYLESYSALDIHVLIRFGKWMELLDIVLPTNQSVMMYRTAMIKYGRAIALSIMGRGEEAKLEINDLEQIRIHPEANARFLHNNTIDKLLEVDETVARGEHAYFDGRMEESFILLQKAVELDDGLNFDEPWGRLQPVRHTLGGLLMEQERYEEAELIYRKDLELHIDNPWGLTGLIACLKHNKLASSGNNGHDNDLEWMELEKRLDKHQSHEWADFKILYSCGCCGIKEGTCTKCC